MAKLPIEKVKVGRMIFLSSESTYRIDEIRYENNNTYFTKLTFMRENGTTGSTYEDRIAWDKCWYDKAVEKSWNIIPNWRERLCQK